VDAEMTTATGNHDVELEVLLEVIFQTYHHDFRHYVRSSLRRRLDQAVMRLRCGSISGLLDRVRRDPHVFAQLIRHMTIPVSDMFRDPSYWRVLRERVVPHLSTYPFVRVWIAGCGLGEEAYSMAILLAEEGLLDRTQIYATDIAIANLERAQGGIYDLDRVTSFAANYVASGGKRALSDYYVATSSRFSLAPELRARILFADHSLATDAAFAEVQLVSCRNVLIYFDRTLQDRAIGVFGEALCPRGFLGIGDKETLMFSSRALVFQAFDVDEKVYQKRGAS
jgi:chemotaxis protein methyltransferase CheR